MASPALDILVGVSWDTSAEIPIVAAMPITDVTLPGAEIEVFDSSSQASTVAKSFIPADLYDCGTLEFTVHHKQDADFYSEVGNTGSWILDLPNSGSKISFAGILQSYQPQATTLNEPMMADVIIKIDGDVGVTAP